MKNKFNIFEWLFGVPKEKNIKQEKNEIQRKKIEKQNTEEHTEVCSDIFINKSFTDFQKENKHEVIEENIQAENDYKKTTTIDESTNIINIKNYTIEEIEKMIKNDYYEVNRIKYELQILKKDNKDELNFDEINKIINDLQDLIKKFEKIKKDFYTKNYDKINSNGINDSYINHLIEEYKDALKNNNIKNIGLIQIKEIEEYLDIINSIATIEKDTEKLNLTFEEKKEELGITNKAIEEYENNYLSIEKINKYINSFYNDQESIINDIKSKVDNNCKITKTVEFQTQLYVNYNALLTATLLMATSSMIPPTRSGNLLKIGLMAASIAGFANAIRVSTKEKKVISKVDYIDYEPTIKTNIENVNNLDNTLNKSIKDIRDIKKNFSKEFSQYKNMVPQFTELLSKLDSLEKEMITKIKIAKEYEKKLQETLKKNNVKIKRLEEEYFN